MLLCASSPDIEHVSGDDMYPDMCPPVLKSMHHCPPAAFIAARAFVEPPRAFVEPLGVFVEPPKAFVEPPATLVQHPGILLESPRSLPCSRGSQAAAATGSRDRQQRQAAEIGCRRLLQSLPPAGSCDRQPLKKFHADFNNSFAWLGVGRSRPSNFLCDSAQAFTRFQNAMRDETRV